MRDPQRGRIILFVSGRVNSPAVRTRFPGTRRAVGRGTGRRRNKQIQTDLTPSPLPSKEGGPEDLTPQPPSLRRKGEPVALAGEAGGRGAGERTVPQKYETVLSGGPFWAFWHMLSRHALSGSAREGRGGSLPDGSGGRGARLGCGGARNGAVVRAARSCGSRASRRGRQAVGQARRAACPGVGALVAARRVGGMRSARM